MSIDITHDVDCIASGYEWICPVCDEMHEIVAYTDEKQRCISCGAFVKLNEPEHCIGD